MLNRQIEQVVNVKSIAPGGLTLDQLKPFQLAILDEKSQKTVATPADCKNRKWRLVWKSPSTGNGGSFPDKNNVKAPIQSLPIHFVDKVTQFVNPSAERKVFEAYLGYDGISACDTLQFECGQTYQLTLHASGKPVRDLLGRDYTEIVPFTTGCCADCSGDEAITTTLKTIQDSFYTNSFYISQLFDVEQIKDCCPVITPFTETAHHDYCLTICDAGDASALGNVQVAYQSTEIFRESYVDGKSTYRAICRPSGPAAFVQAAEVLQDCATCPAGFTATPARKKYIITINNSGVGDTPAEWLAEVQVVATYSTAVAATRLNYVNGTSIYEVLLPLAFSEPGAPVANTTWAFIAEVPAYCTQTTPTSTAWVSCGDSYKISRKMCITVKNGDCSDAAADLAAIEAFMANVPNIVADSLTQETAGNCLSRYEIEQYSNCLEDGCDWKGSDKARFEDLPGYQGASWAPCSCEGWTFDVNGCPVPPVAATAADCRGGLKFIGKNFENPIVECADDFWEAAETEFTRLEVSITEYGKDGCQMMQIPFKVTQTGTGPQGTGRQMLKREIQARGYSAYEYHGANSPDGNLISARRGEVYSFEADKLYNTVSLYHTSSRNRTAQNYGTDTREVWHLGVEAGKLTLLKQIQTLVNDIAEMQGTCDFLA